MNRMIHRVKSDRSDLDMVFEMKLKLGVPLTFSITEVETNNKTAYSVGKDRLLLICLIPDVQPEDVEQMTETINYYRYQLAMDGIRYIKLNDEEYYVQERVDPAEFLANLDKNAVKVEHSVYDYLYMTAVW